MQLHREWMMSDLAKLQTDRKAVVNLQRELDALEVEFTALKATSYDKVPGGSGGNGQQDKVELNIAKREEIMLCLNATQCHVKHMENLLDQLDRNDRDIIEKMVILHSKTAEQMAEQLGVDTRTVHRRKHNAIENLMRLRFGGGYRP